MFFALIYPNTISDLSVKHFWKRDFSLTWALACQSPSNKSILQSLSQLPGLLRGVSECMFGGAVEFTVLYSLLTRKSFLWEMHNTNSDKAVRKEDSHTLGLSQSYTHTLTDEPYPKKTHTHTNREDLPKNTGASPIVWQPNENDVLFLFGAC